MIFICPYTNITHDYNGKMGRVKTRNVKRIAEELVKEYPDEFSEDFNKNKLKVAELTVVQSKSLRNKIAGHIVAIKKRVVD